MSDTTEKMKTYLKYVNLIKGVESIFAKIAMNRFVVSDPVTSIAEKIYVDGPRFLECIT